MTQEEQIEILIKDWLENFKNVNSRDPTDEEQGIFAIELFRRLLFWST